MSRWPRLRGGLWTVYGVSNPATPASAGFGCRAGSPLHQHQGDPQTHGTRSSFRAASTSHPGTGPEARLCWGPGYLQRMPRPGGLGALFLELVWTRAAGRCGHLWSCHLHSVALFLQVLGGRELLSSQHRLGGNFRSGADGVVGNVESWETWRWTLHFALSLYQWPLGDSFILPLPRAQGTLTVTPIGFARVLLSWLPLKRCVSCSE